MSVYPNFFSALTMARYWAIRLNTLEKHDHDAAMRHAADIRGYLAKAVAEAIGWASR